MSFLFLKVPRVMAQYPKISLPPTETHPQTMVLMLSLLQYSHFTQTHMAVSKNWEPFLGSPYNKGHSILGSIVWSPLYGNATFGMQVLIQAEVDKIGRLHTSKRVLQ